jgi:glycosyltransferase involved in cell wall biosynthesis
MDTVDVLMSIYKPDKVYLIKQLKSIDEQTYKNITLYVYNDCPSERIDKELFKEHIHYPIVFLETDGENRGFIKAFEKLINESKGKYVAFCDQDDIWKKDKIEKCVGTLKKDKSLAVATDRSIINENDEVKIQSVRETVNKNYENWMTGDDICKYDLVICFAVGMCLVADGDFARSTCPISEFSGHDQWLLACASTEGKVSFINEPLVMYRRHDHNVSGVMNDVKSKKQYYEKRVLAQKKMYEDFFKKYPNHKDKDEMMDFVEKRMNHSTIGLLHYRYLAPDVVKFEIVLSIVPNFIFKFLRFVARRLSRI